MDELTLLREHDRDVAAPRDEVIEAARRSLGAAMSDAGKPTSAVAGRGLARLARPRRTGTAAAAIADPNAVQRAWLTRRGLLVGAGAVAATCTAVALLSFGAMPGPTASAAETLHAAAVATDAADAPVQGVSKHVQQFVGSTLDAEGRSVTDQSLLVEWTQTQRPTEDGSDWVRTWTAPQAIQAWGRDTQELIDRTNRESVAADPWYLSSSVPEDFWDGPDPDDIRAMPRDPAALLQRLRETSDDSGDASSETERVFYAALSVLGSGLADSELQSATYRALELLPGLRASRGSDIDGRQGVVITSPPRRGRDDLSLIIDPATGRFLGYTELRLHGLNGAPAGTVERAAAFYFGG